jgi:cytoskeletal protein CcmA (bactofilin family)
MADNVEATVKGLLVVGEGVSLKGTFSVPDKATISGTVEGELTAKEINVLQTGIVRGKVIADVIDISGQVFDSLTSKRSLFVRSTGVLTGTVKYAELEIEKGGRLEGQLDRVSDADTAPAGRPAVGAPGAPFPPAKDGGPDKKI